MNIIILGPAYPLRGGIAHHTALLSRELGKKHAVQVVTFKRQYPTLLFPGKTQKETGGDLLRVQSEELLDSVNPFNWIAAGWNIRARSGRFAHLRSFNAVLRPLLWNNCSNCKVEKEDEDALSLP